MVYLKLQLVKHWSKHDIGIIIRFGRSTQSTSFSKVTLKVWRHEQVTMVTSHMSITLVLGAMTMLWAAWDMSCTGNHEIWQLTVLPVCHVSPPFIHLINWTKIIHTSKISSKHIQVSTIHHKNSAPWFCAFWVFFQFRTGCFYQYPS